MPIREDKRTRNYLLTGRTTIGEQLAETLPALLLNFYEEKPPAQGWGSLDWLAAARLSALQNTPASMFFCSPAGMAA